MSYISNILYWISTGLLVPVIVLLIILFACALLLIGNFFSQYLTTRRTNATLQQQLDGINAETLHTLQERLPANNKSLAVSYLRSMLKAQKSTPHIQQLLANFEIEADKDLAMPKTLTKLAPMLGLMGTLIPMGPALVGLSTGDIASMAYNMQVAFATTVVGLFASAVGLITLQIKQRWYLQQLTYLQFVADLLNEKK